VSRTNDATSRSPGRQAGLGRLLLPALGLVLAVVSLLYMLRPIWDSDFFWHLKTGEWILEHRRLPAADPFSYTAPAEVTPAVRFTLTTYWLSQLLFHALHAAGGWTAIALMRFLFAGALFAVVWSRRRGDPVVSMALLLVFAVAFLETNPVERPQTLSFICFGLLLRLLDGLRRSPGESPLSARGYRDPLLVALLMVFWANVHGGHALGQATLIVYLVVEGVKFAHCSLGPAGRGAYRRLLAAGVAGLLASLLNPNTYHGLWLALATPTIAPGSHGLLTISEYLSVLEALRINHSYIRVVDLAMMALAAAAVVSTLRRPDLTEAVLAAGTGYFAFRHTRYFPVFMIVALPLVGEFLSRHPWRAWGRALAVSSALLLVGLFAWNERQGLRRLRSGEWVIPSRYPVKAADFIVARNLRGNMYNYYTWGGYLIWRLGPERKVFLDGRNLNPEVFWEGSMIDNAFALGGRPQWESLFEKYDVSYAVVPLELKGKPVPLVGGLSRDPRWAAVFIGDNAVVFSRK